MAKAVKRKSPKRNQSQLTTKMRFLLVAVVFGVMGVGYVLFTNAATASGPIVGIGKKCLDNYANLKKEGNPVVLYTCNKTDAQTWTVNDNYTIKNKNGLCLTASGKKSRDIVTLNSCRGTAEQKWLANSSNNTIVSVASGLCLDDRSASTADRNPIQVYACNKTEAQVWRPNRVNVQAPSITTFKAEPTTVTVGGKVNISWATTNATTCSVTPGGPTDSMATSWTTPVLSKVGQVTYSLYCKNSVGATTSKSVVITVAAKPTATPTPTPQTGDPAGWVSYYSTEFRDLNGWTVKNETQDNDNSRNIPQNVVPASVANGKGLTIHGKRESGYTVPYTSGDILGKSSNMIVPNYFRAEVIGNVMDESGLWPALLWFRPNNSNDGEIDVMEYMGGEFSGNQRRVAITMHNEYGSTHRQWAQPVLWTDLSNPSITAKHKYTIEKTPGQIKIWVDDDPKSVRYFGTTSAVTSQKKDWWNRIMENPDRTWYPRITLQIGEGKSGKIVPNPSSSWQQSKMTVDSLKMWKMK